MTNRKNIFFASFAVIFFLSAALLLAFQYKDQKQIELLSSLVLSVILAFIGSAIGTLVLPTIPQFEATTPKIVLIAFRVCLVAGLIGFFGGALAFLGFPKLGWRIGITCAVIGNIIIWTFLIGKVLGLFKKEND